MSILWGIASHPPQYYYLNIPIMANEENSSPVINKDTSEAVVSVRSVTAKKQVRDSEGRFITTVNVINLS